MHPNSSGNKTGRHTGHMKQGRSLLQGRYICGDQDCGIEPVLGGDSVAPLGDLLRVTRSLALALISRRLVDLDQELALAEARDPLC